MRVRSVSFTSNVFSRPTLRGNERSGIRCDRRSAITARTLLIIFLLASFPIIVVAQKLSVINLRCEYRLNPAGVDAARPMLSWELMASDKNVLQTAYRILVSDDYSLIEKNIGNAWDSKKINSPASVQVAYNGKPLLPAKKYYWKVMVWDNKGRQSHSDPANWQMGLLTANDWKNAQWIAYDQLPDSNIIVPFAHGRGKKEWGPRKDILPLFRKNFTVKKPIENATVFISGLGHFEMSINGSKTADHFLDPGWTQYNKHALYVSFDIAEQLQQGQNTIGVMLGNGFYYIPGERYRKLTGAYGYPKMIARIVIEYEDGTTDDFVSDASWTTSPSPIIFSSIYGGEDYDANLEQSGWNKPSFDDSKWKKVVVTTGPSLLQSQVAEPVKVMQTFESPAPVKLKNGAWVYDLKQNFSGIPSVSVNGKKGDTVRIIPGELLNEDGSVTQRGTGGPSFFTYILKGGSNETWQPRFTYYGFRYLQVHCIPKDSLAAPPQITDIDGLHIRNSAETIGKFTTSNTLFERTYDLINWAIKSNTVSVFTDCPHREKLGWLEQTHLVGSSVQYNYNIAALCKKVIRDMIQAQAPDGLIPEISPEYVHFEDPFRDSPEWGSAAIILPWYAYQWYGDKSVLIEAYDMMKRYVNYLHKKAVNNILSQGLGDWYDIGPNRPGFSQMTPAGVTATAIYYYDLVVMDKIAALLGKTADASSYRQLAAAVKKSFNEKFFDKKTYSYATGSQAANAMALHLGLVESVYKDSVVASLVKDIRNRNNALTAGDIGFRYVLRALEDANRSDVIFDMNSRDDVPGYGFQLKNGATALTESWQALPIVSNNHFMLGHLMEWFYAGLCGIKQAEGSVAYKRIVIKPQPAGDITYAAAVYHSPYGVIGSDWKKENGNFELNVTIPVNTTAEIYLPGSKKAIKVGSGSYKYITKDAKSAM